MNHSIETVRHSTAHLLAAAVLELWPGTKLGVGPVIENGFFYDLEPPRPISVGDFSKIEKRMRQIIARGEAFTREEMKLDAAIDFFKQKNQPYKVELLTDLKTKGTTAVKADEAQDLDVKKPSVASVYWTGKFVDLCRGPHVDSAKELGVFKLTKVAGAYWRGDQKNPQLTRIYGLSFARQEELDAHIKMMEESEKRDHRKVGADLDLFVFSDIVGKGLPLWTEHGATIRRILERFIVDEELRRGYLHVYTPDIANIALYEKSGHYPYYKDSMYAPITIDDEQYMLRPMSCPHHFELYLSRPRSYRELPIRYAELVKLYRYEQSGELTGLMRVRSFTLADSHIFCKDGEQAAEEINKALDLIEFVSKSLGLRMGEDYWYRLSLGDRADDKKYIKDDAAWDDAETKLRGVLQKRKARFVEAIGEAAFYGPKIDIQMKNVRGKDDTAFTVQYDFVMPKRFHIDYTAEDGTKKEVVVVHRSSIGAIERIIAFLIEKNAGAFPVWLAPVQVAIVPVGESHAKVAARLEKMLTTAGIRAHANLSRDTVGYKIRAAEKHKVPYMLVIGDKEKSLRNLSVRVRGVKTLKKMSVSAFVKRVTNEITKKR